MSPSTPQPHRDMENITVPIHTGLMHGGRSGVQWNKGAFWGLRSISRIDLLYSGQVRPANTNAPSIQARQGSMRRELWTTWEGGSIHFCHAWSHSSACICHKLLHWLRHNMCYWICCTKEVGFYFQLYSGDGWTGWRIGKVFSAAAE